MTGYDSTVWSPKRRTYGRFISALYKEQEIARGVASEEEVDVTKKMEGFTTDEVSRTLPRI